MDFEITYIAETDSTNRWMKEHGGERDAVVWADYQTAGRGCGTNTWESERGRNLLFSVLVHPKNVPATTQFILSMANALALKEALDTYVDGVKIKWPNDIYWLDKKISGTLIETTLQGSIIKTCIIGTGLNVNQWRFDSDAPNPVSLCQILQHEVSLEEVRQRILSSMTKCLTMVKDGSWDAIRTNYHANLYRKEEIHGYRFTDGTSRQCRLIGVTDDGHLELEEAKGKELYSLTFKEVQFII